MKQTWTYFARARPVIVPYNDWWFRMPDESYNYHYERMFKYRQQETVLLHTFFCMLHNLSCE